MCVLIFLQLRREFRAIAKVDGRAASLMSSWPDWVGQLVQFSKAEAATRPVILESFFWNTRLVQAWIILQVCGLHVCFCCCLSNDDDMLKWRVTLYFVSRMYFHFTLCSLACENVAAYSCSNS